MASELDIFIDLIPLPPKVILIIHKVSMLPVPLSGAPITKV